jgi:hypothetical protein
MGVIVIDVLNPEDEAPRKKEPEKLPPQRPDRRRELQLEIIPVTPTPRKVT